MKLPQYLPAIILKSPYFNGSHLEFSYSTYTMIVRIHSQVLCVQKCVHWQQWNIFRHLQTLNSIDMYMNGGFDIFDSGHLAFCCLLELANIFTRCTFIYVFNNLHLTWNQSPKIESEKVVTYSIGFAFTINNIKSSY